MAEGLTGTFIAKHAPQISKVDIKRGIDKLEKEKRQAIVDLAFDQLAQNKFFFGEREFNTSHGKITLLFRCIPNQIEIIDKDNPYFQLAVSVQPSTLEDQPGWMIQFRAYTSNYGPRSEKHPLLSAGYFLNKSFNYFDQTRFKPVVLKNVWAKHGELASDIAAQYALNKSAGQSITDSADNTLSGKFAKQFDFDLVSVQEDDDNIIAYYKRNEPKENAVLTPVDAQAHA